MNVFLEKLSGENCQQKPVWKSLVFSSAESEVF